MRVLTFAHTSARAKRGSTGRAQYAVGLLALCIAAMSACAGEPPAGRALLVRVSDERGTALARASVDVDGLPATATDAHGVARISLAPEGPPRARIGVSCPAGDREPNPRHVARHVEGGTARLELSFVCRPSLRMLAVVVRAEGAAGSVLRADGEPLGTVAADGSLHAVLWRAPDSELQLMIDTGERALRPHNPLREHRMADRDELLVLDQPFARLTPDAERSRRASRDHRPRPFGGRR